MKKTRQKYFQQKYSDIHQSDAYCPSIQKVRSRQCGTLFEENKLEYLLAQNQLKRLGIQTASALIKALHQQNTCLKNENCTYQYRLEQMYQQFTEKQNACEIHINTLQGRIKYYQQLLRNKEDDNMDSCVLSYSGRKLQVEKRNGKRVKFTKSRLSQSPIKKVTLVQTVSKQYIPYEYASSSSNLYQEVKSTLLSKDLQKILIDFQQMANLLRQENQGFQNYKQGYQDKQVMVKQLCQQINSSLSNKKYNQKTTMTKHLSAQTKKYKKMNITGRKLFSTQINKDRQAWQDKAKEDSYHNTLQKVLKQYQDIIQQYKQYSAYLKAYLCSCISFIGRQSLDLNSHLICEDHMSSVRYTTKSEQSEAISTDRSDCTLNFPSNKIFNVVFNDIIEVLELRFEADIYTKRQVLNQNKQLRQILDRMVQNLKQMGIQNKRTYNRKQNQFNSFDQKKDIMISQVNKQNIKSVQRSEQRQKQSKNSIHNQHSCYPQQSVLKRRTLTQTSDYC